MPKVFITNKIPDSCALTLRKKGFSVEVNESGRPLGSHDLEKVVASHDAIISSVSDKIDEEVIAKASPALKVIANYAVGFDNIDILAAKRRGIIVCNTPGVAGEAVAEHTFALILACLKNIVGGDKYVRTGKYKVWEPILNVAPQLWGKTIGIIGLGRIGTYVGHIAFGGFKMKILYHDVVRSEDFEMVTEAQSCGLRRLLKEADVVTLHLPLTEQTRHLIDTGELRLMKKSAILINTARGAIVNEKALIYSLRNNLIAAAGLDVFEHEPDISDELTVLPNVVLSPHTASATVECREAMSKITAENVSAVFEGKVPPGALSVS